MEEQHKKEDKVGLNRDYVKLVLGTVAFVALVGLSFWITAESTKLLFKNDGKELNFGFVSVIVSGLILSICILIIGSLITYFLDWKIINVTNKYYIKKIKSLTNTLHQVEEGITGDGGILTIVKDHLKKERDIKNIDKIALAGDYNKLQDDFLAFAGLKERKDQSDLYIVGTMLGTYGQNAISLAERLSELSNSQKTRKPFRDAYFGSLGHEKNDKPDKSEFDFNKYIENALYPFSARLTAGLILLEFFEKWYNKEKKRIPSSEELEISINFLPRLDIFPAIQLWENKALMMLCSTGVSDRYDNIGDEANKRVTAISKAMPVAIVMKSEEYELHETDNICYLGESLIRIEKHLKNDYGLDKKTNRDLETWTLDVTGTGEKSRFFIKNYKKLHEEDQLFSLIKKHDDIIDQYGEGIIEKLEKYFKVLNSSEKKSISVTEFTEIMKTLKDIITALAYKY